MYSEKYVLQDLPDYHEVRLDDLHEGVITLGKIPVSDNVLLIGARRDKEWERTGLNISVDDPGASIYITRYDGELLQAAIMGPYGYSRRQRMLREPIEGLQLIKDARSRKWQALVDYDNVVSSLTLRRFVGAVAIFASDKMPELA